MSFGSVGTDTGGSVRIPASACGLTGLKPGWNELPADGVIPLSRQLDHVGPLARSVVDAWLLFEAMRGSPRSAGEELEGPSVRGLKLGVLDHYFFERMDVDVENVVRGAGERLRSAGAQLSEVIVPHARDIAPVYLHMVLADGAAYHATELARHGERYTAPVRLRLEMGRYVLGEDYARALRGRDVLRHAVEKALVGVDALLLPTLPIAAPVLGQASVVVRGGTESVRSAMLRCTQLFNLTGHPAITMPCGHTKSGLPVGLQLVGGLGRTNDLLCVARSVESALDAAR